MSLKDYLIQLTVNNDELTAEEKSGLISFFLKEYAPKRSEAQSVVRQLA